MQQRTVRKERVYVNSYTQKQSGNDDVQFRIDLGRIHNNVFKVELQQVCIENKFLNFYDSIKGDFRDLSFKLGATQYNVFIDRYIDISNIEAVLLAKTGVTFTLTLLSDGRLKFTVVTVATTVTLLGFGWEKLGFDRQVNDLGIPQPQPLIDLSFEALKLPDFGYPPMILIAIQQFVSHQNSISNRFGVESFVVPTGETLQGSRIQWVNTNIESNQYVLFQQPQSLQFLDVQLRSCDQKILSTAADKNGKLNNQDLEMIMVLSLHCYE